MPGSTGVTDGCARTGGFGLISPVYVGTHQLLGSCRGLPQIRYGYWIRVRVMSNRIQYPMAMPPWVHPSIPLVVRTLGLRQRAGGMVLWALNEHCVTLKYSLKSI